MTDYQPVAAWTNGEVDIHVGYKPVGIIDETIPACFRASYDSLEINREGRGLQRQTSILALPSALGQEGRLPRVVEETLVELMKPGQQPTELMSIVDALQRMAHAEIEVKAGATC